MGCQTCIKENQPLDTHNLVVSFDVPAQERSKPVKIAEIETKVCEFDIPLSPDIDFDKIIKVYKLKEGFAEIEEKIKALKDFNLTDAKAELSTIAEQKY